MKTPAAATIARELPSPLKWIPGVELAGHSAATAGLAARFQLLCILAMICLRPAAAAQLLAVPGDAGSSVEAVATWENGGKLRLLYTDGTQSEFSAFGRAKAEALTWIDPCGVVLLGGGETFLLTWTGRTLDCALLGAGPHNVRTATGLAANRLAVISGGEYVGGVLKGAQVSLWELFPYCRKLWDRISRQMNPQSLTVGNLEGHRCVLIGVHKSVILEPVVRLRPWVYRLEDERLVAVWKGSSFSQPYVAATFADVCPESPHDEVCALELTRGRQCQIIIYQWRGFVMEGIAQSAPAPFGDTIKHAQATDGETALYVWVGGQCGQIVGLEVPQWPKNSLARLEPRYQTQQMPRPVAWDIGWFAGRPAAYVLSEWGELIRMPLVAVAEE